MQTNLENIVNHRIAMIAVLLKRQIFRVIANNNLDITPEQWIILNHLWQKDGIPSSELAEAANKDLANATRIVNRLEKLGYIRKEKDTNDKRTSIVYLTPKAETIKPAVLQCWKESTDIALKGIGDNDKEYLLKLLNKIESNIVDYMK